MHRNGKTIDDEIIILKPGQVFEAMNTIDVFASEISRRIRETLDELIGDF